MLQLIDVLRNSSYVFWWFFDKVLRFQSNNFLFSDFYMGIVPENVRKVLHMTVQKRRLTFF